MLLCFCYQRRVPLEERKSPDDICDIVPQIRSAVKKDRDIMEKGLRAFVSYIRAYKEHHCSYIFKLVNFMIGKLGMGYGLLLLPAMLDLKHHNLSTEAFTPLEDISLDEIKSKQQLEYASYQHTLRNLGCYCMNVLVKFVVAFTWLMLKIKLSILNHSNKNEHANFEDDDEMAQEYRLLKKLERGAINESEFAKLTATEDLL
ncbi:unnamed protein product [Coffea canephora]|uniref:DH200=94 genomic scaffold, scaffold_171 n=1 Tax=Coffea canephora TaxID=49390 RepID=A0A068VAC8_COFCA|nr:unnamed protein product [Coffea canephora]